MMGMSYQEEAIRNERLLRRDEFTAAFHALLDIPGVWPDGIQRKLISYNRFLIYDIRFSIS